METIVCVGEDGSLYVDGRKQPSLEAMRQAIATARRPTSAANLLLAIDERTPFSLAKPVIDAYRSALPRDYVWGARLLLLVEGCNSSDGKWMDDLNGCVLDMGLSNSTSALTARASMPQALVQIAAHGKCTLNGQSVTASYLLDRLSPTWCENVRISAEGDVPFGSVVAVLNECKRHSLPVNFVLRSAVTQPPETQPVATQP